jgi:hypothetical protein
MTKLMNFLMDIFYTFSTRRYQNEKHAFSNTFRPFAFDMMQKFTVKMQ